MAWIKSKVNKKYLPPSLATTKGHLGQDIQGELFTKYGHKSSHPSVSLNLCTDELLNLFPLYKTLNIPTNDVIFSLLQNTYDNKAYSDLTGNFLFLNPK